MAIVKILKVISTGNEMNLNLGFIPSRLDIVDYSSYAAGVGFARAQWFNTMPNGSAMIDTIRTYGTTPPVTSTAAFSLTTVDGVTPFQSTDSTLWTETVRVITGITKAAQAVVTSADHGFTDSDIGVTTVTFNYVEGMTQINTLRGVIQSVPNDSTFSVNINTTSFSAYVSGGQANIVTGIPPFTTSGFQVFNTPQKNRGFIGVTLGDLVVGSTTDILLITAFLDADFTS